MQITKSPETLFGKACEEEAIEGFAHLKGSRSLGRVDGKHGLDQFDDSLDRLGSLVDSFFFFFQISPSGNKETKEEKGEAQTLKEKREWWLCTPWLIWVVVQMSPL